MIDFTGVTALRIPEGDVTKVVRKSDGVVLWEKVASRLPREYQEVKWIGATGTHVIQYSESFGTTNETRMKVSFSQHASQWVCGSYTNNTYYLGARMSGSQKTLDFYSSSPSVYTRATVNLLILGILYTIVIKTDFSNNSNYSISQNENILWSGTGAISSTRPTSPTIWGIGNYSDFTTAGLRGEIYGFQHLRDGVIVHDFVPCYRKADGVTGMYDLITKTFHTNAGTGSFTKGPDDDSDGGLIETTIPIVWKPGYVCSYTVGQSYTPTANSSYTVSEVIAVEPGVTYTVYVKATADGSAFRFVGANSNGVVTETVNCPVYAGNNTFAFTPSNGTTQMRIRTYAGDENWTWNLSKR